MNLIVFLVFMTIKNSGGFSKEKIHFLEDYFAKIQISEPVEVHVCWNKNDQLKLLNVLRKTESSYLVGTHQHVKDYPHLNQRTFITDMKCTFFYSLLENAFLREFYKYPNKWIIFGNRTTLKQRAFYFPINSHVMVIEPTVNDIWKMVALYQPNNEWQYLEDQIGTWAYDKGFLSFNKLTIIKNRTDFHRMPLRVSYVFLDNNSLEHIYDNRFKHIDKPTKINYLMYEHMVDIWNMTHTKLYTTTWGSEIHPKKLYYKGLFGDLWYGRADVGGSVHFTPPERLKYFKYLLNTVKGLRLAMIFRAPPLPYTRNLFVLPFDGRAWIGCGLILGLCCFVIWIILKWESKEPSFEKIRNNNEENFPDVVMMQIGVVCQMDYLYEPKSTSGKIATLTLLLSFMFLYTAFSARIVILLQTTANNLNDVKTLYDSKMDIGAEDTPYNRYFFSTPSKGTNEEMRRLIYDTKLVPKEKTSNFYTAPVGMKLVQTSYFAFHVEVTTASDVVEATFSDQEKCSLKSVDSVYNEAKTHISCRRNSTIVEYILIGFHKMFETGVHSRENRRKISEMHKCTGQSNIFVSVGLIELYFAFEAFSIGVCMSLLILFIELILYRNFKYQKHSKGND